MSPELWLVIAGGLAGAIPAAVVAVITSIATAQREQKSFERENARERANFEREKERDKANFERELLREREKERQAKETELRQVQTKDIDRKLEKLDKLREAVGAFYAEASQLQEREEEGKPSTHEIYRNILPEVINGNDTNLEYYL